MQGFVGQFFTKCLFPNNLTISAIEGEYGERVDVAGRRAASTSSTSSPSTPGSFGRLRSDCLQWHWAQVMPYPSVPPSALLPFRLLLSFGLGALIRFDGGQDIDAVSPDDGRRVSLAW